MNTYRQIVATGRGGPEVLELRRKKLRQPARNEVRLRVLAAPVSLPDVEARYGRSPFPPKLPFIPGYAAIGKTDAFGDEVKGVSIGDRFAAMTAYGGYSEVMYVKAKQLIPVPDSVDPVRAAPILLNYIVAYHCLHLVAKVKPGQSVLLIGASGGIGSAFLQLGQLAELDTYALASKAKHGLLERYGALPIDYRTQDYREIMQERLPHGLDAVFDGVGGDYIGGGFALLKPGGIFVGYANPFSLRRTFVQLGQVLLLNLLPNGRSASYYSTGRSYFNRQLFLDDWAKLFDLLKAEQIDPVIAAVYPLQQAAEANAKLESGTVEGNIVLKVDSKNGEV